MWLKLTGRILIAVLGFNYSVGALAQAVTTRMEQSALDAATTKERNVTGWIDQPATLPGPTSPNVTPLAGSAIYRAPTAGDVSLDRAASTKWSTQFAPASKAATLDSAQSGQDMASQSLDALMPNPNADYNRAQDGVTSTSSTGRKVNVNELFPNFNQTEANEMSQMGKDTYADPTKLEALTKQNSRNRRKDGCRRTEFVSLYKQQTSSARAADANHRIYRITFQETEKRAVVGAPEKKACFRNGNPNAECVQEPLFDVDTKASTYSQGQVRLQLPTLGASASTWQDQVDEGHAIRYEYTPFSAGTKYNYFTYNHRLFFVVNGAMQDATQHVASYGTAKDKWTSVITTSVPQGTREVILLADLYRTEVNYYEPPPSGCMPDPPTTCAIPSRGGDVINWCPGERGASVLEMYDDRRQDTAANTGHKWVNDAIANTARNDHSSDTGLQAQMVGKMNASSGTKAMELVNSCNRISDGSFTQNGGKPYNREQVNNCEKIIKEAFTPNGCSGMQRQFGLAEVGDHVYLRVRGWNKVKLPVLDALGKPTGQFTYRRDPVPVQGAVANIARFPVLSPALDCPDCNTEPEEGYYVEYIHSPFGGDPKKTGVSRIRMLGGTATASHFGRPSDGWLPAVSATADSSRTEVEFAAALQMVTVNEITGCNDYLKMVSDNLCKKPTMACTDQRSTVTSGSVTFGHGLATSGFIDMLSPWLKGSASFPDYAEAGPSAPNASDSEDWFGLDKMCWGAKGGPLLQCGKMEGEGVQFDEITEGDKVYQSNCAYAENVDGKKLSQCRPLPAFSVCADQRFVGLFSGICYVENKAFDCGEQAPGNWTTDTENQVDVCQGTLRCVGTECTRPNLTGSSKADFATAASGMEALNMMKYDMVCAETGKPPASLTETCTLSIFGGKQYYCSYTVGSGKVITDVALVDGNCCRQARKDVKNEAPNWMQYLQGYYIVKKIGENSITQSYLANTGIKDVYNNAGRFYGEVSDQITAPFHDLYDKGSAFINDSIVKPVSSGLDRFFGASGSSTTIPAEAAADGVTKLPAAQSYFGKFGSALKSFQQELMKRAFEFVNAISPELANAIFMVGPDKVITLTPGFELAMNSYLIFRLIVQIIFACKTPEYEWAANEKWRLCSFAGTCCSKKVAFLGCIQKRDLYCCYKSIAARVIATEILRKGLIPGRSGYQVQGCSVNCSGFTPQELGQVDWAQVDLTEWTDSLIESGLINPQSPESRYGVQGNEIDLSRSLAIEDSTADIDRTVPAVKTVELLKENSSELLDMSRAVDQFENCYDPNDKSKMPSSYAACKPAEK